jgi:hypothetical protein
MPPSKKYEDQITTPLPLPLGLALRVQSAATGQSISVIIRRVLVDYFRNDETMRKLVQHFEKLDSNELMHEKIRLMNQFSTGYISGGDQIIEDYLAEKQVK